MIAWTPEDEASEQKRLATLADALGCKPDEVSPGLLEQAGIVLGCMWFDVSAEKCAMMPDEVRAAVAATLAPPVAP